MSSEQQYPNPHDNDATDEAAPFVNEPAQSKPARQPRARGPVRAPKGAQAAPDAATAGSGADVSPITGSTAAKSPRATTPRKPAASRTKAPASSSADPDAQAASAPSARKTPAKPAAKAAPTTAPAASTSSKPSAAAASTASTTPTAATARKPRPATESARARAARTAAAKAAESADPRAVDESAENHSTANESKAKVRSAAVRRSTQQERPSRTSATAGKADAPGVTPTKRTVRAPKRAAAEVVRDATTSAPRRPSDASAVPVGTAAVDSAAAGAETTGRKTAAPKSAAAKTATAKAATSKPSRSVEGDSAASAAATAADEVALQDALVAIGLVDTVEPDLTVETEEADAVAELEIIEELAASGQLDVVEVEAPAVPRKKKAGRQKLPPATVAPPATAPTVLSISGLTKSYGATQAVAGIDLAVRTGSFYGIVGPNGAGKTTTLSMVTGLLRPDSGSVVVHGIDVWGDPAKAKRLTGVLPDRLRLFDRLTGAQLLYYSGVLRGLDSDTVRSRSADLVSAFGLDEAVNRLVADYSAGMTKKIALACAMIHSPRLLVLDEPFEAVDPVSAANLIEILQRYVAAGGTVVLSSHGMDLIERVCDSVAIIVQGKVLAAGTLDEVRKGERLEDRFVELAGGRKVAEGMEWLHSFSD
ncbi:MAG: ATP-binding cassette domain-containing protein [Leifsonia sp.]